MDVDVCRFFPVGQWQSNYHIIYYSTSLARLLIVQFLSLKVMSNDALHLI